MAVLRILHYFEKSDISSETASGSSILSGLLSGVQNHLSCPSINRRRLGMDIGRAVSILIDPKNPLDWGEENEESESNLEPKPNPKPEETPQETPKVIPKKKKDKKQEILEDDPDQLFSMNVENENDESSESESDDLKPYNLEDDMEDLKPAQAQIKYIRQCLNALTSEEPEVIESALNVVTDLIKEDPGDLMEIGVGLASILLRLSNEYNLKNFSTNRHQALVQIVVRCPNQVVPFLANEFFGQSIFVVQKMDILEILVDSIRILAGTHKTKETTAESSRIIEVKKGDDRKDNNTRRWGKGNKQTQTIPVKPFTVFEPFLSFLGIIYNQIQKNIHLQYEYTLFGSDGILIGKLIHSIGIFIENIPTYSNFRVSLKSTLELIYLFRYHAQAIVRRAVTYCTISVFRYIEKSGWDVGEFAEDVYEIKEWMVKILESESDDECRLLSGVLISQLQNMSLKQSDPEDTPLLTPIQSSKIKL